MAAYRLAAAPGFRFVWAAHALLDLSDDARLLAPAGRPVRRWPEHWRSWPHYEQIDGRWPAPLGAPLDRPANDGTAHVFALLGLTEVAVEDRGDRLRFALEAPGRPVAVGIWRNLGAWPPAAPYRSVGVEPMIGWHVDRDRVGAGEAGIVPATGTVERRLRLSATA